MPRLATFAANDGGVADERSGFRGFGRAAGRTLDDDVFGGELFGGQMAARQDFLAIDSSIANVNVVLMDHTAGVSGGQARIETGS